MVVSQISYEPCDSLMEDHIFQVQPFHSHTWCRFRTSLSCSKYKPSSKLAPTQSHPVCVGGPKHWVSFQTSGLWNPPTGCLHPHSSLVHHVFHIHDGGNAMTVSSVRLRVAIISKGSLSSYFTSNIHLMTEWHDQKKQNRTKQRCGQRSVGVSFYLSN